MENKEISLKINQSYDVNMINNYAYKIIGQVIKDSSKAKLMYVD